MPPEPPAPPTPPPAEPGPRRIRRFVWPALLLAVTLWTWLIYRHTPVPPVPAHFQPFTQDIAGTLVRFDMVPVPGGTVEMDLPDDAGKIARRKVTVGPLYWGKYEVTLPEYDAWRLMLDRTDLDYRQKYNYEANLRPSPFYGLLNHGWGNEGLPAMHVTYYCAQTYCRWLSGKTGRKYRLPTEAEWQYACLAGGTGPKDAEELRKVAWYADNSDERAHECGTRAPNAFGLYDMLGNVAEWVVPADGEKFVPSQSLPLQTDAMTGIPNGAKNYWAGVVKGGSYSHPAEDVSPTARAPFVPEWQQSDDAVPNSHYWLWDAPFVGFRVVCEP